MTFGNSRRDTTPRVQDVSPVPPIIKLTKMLKTEPSGAKPEIVEIWRRMRPLTYEELQEYWKLVEPNVNMTNFAAEFTEWHRNGWQNMGMKHTVSNKRHGVVRRIASGGDIGVAI